MRTALLGGTFDPPHVAHLVAAEAAFRQLDVEDVTFLPAGSPWQKEGRLVTEAGHRLAMTRLAIEGVDYFRVDAREVVRPGPSYMIDTLETFPADAEIVLLLGADAASRIRTWHRADEVLKRVALAVAPRPGTDRAAVEDSVEGGVTWLDMPELGVSGTLIRRRLAAGRSVRFLVAEAVWRYIGERRVYAPQEMDATGR